LKRRTQIEIEEASLARKAAEDEVNAKKAEFERQAERLLEEREAIIANEKKKMMADLAKK